MAAPFVAGTIWRSARLLHEVRFYGIPYSPVFVQRQPESETGFAHRIATSRRGPAGRGRHPQRAATEGRLMWGFRAFYRNPLTGEHLVVLKDWTRITVHPDTLAQLIRAKEETK